MAGDDNGRAMACLSAIREGRSWFDAKILTHMGGVSAARDETTVLLRSDNAFHVAEFFYVARELGLLRRDRLPLLIARHNADMDKLLGDLPRAESMGLTRQRVEEAKFSKGQLSKILDDQPLDGEDLLALDLSDMSKLLSPLMSPESCRQILQSMAQAGLLKTKGRARVFVYSPGILEGYFQEHLLIIDRSMRDAA